MFSVLNLIIKLLTINSLVIYGRADLTVRLNIIILVADDMGWGDVGYHSDQMLTPNIDTLTANGILLNNYYTSPVCSPSRGALLTGVHPIHSGYNTMSLYRPFRGECHWIWKLCGNISKVMITAHMPSVCHIIITVFVSHPSLKRLFNDKIMQKVLV